MSGKHTLRLKWNPFVKVANGAEHTHPDLIWETEDEIRIIEIGCPNDGNVGEANKEKSTKYLLLQADQQNKTGKKANTHPIVIGNTGAVGHQTARHLETLELDISLQWLQKIAAIETVNMVQTCLLYTSDAADEL